MVLFGILSVVGYFVLFRTNIAQIIHKDLCGSKGAPIQCQALVNSNRLPGNFDCDPLGKKSCKVNDLVSDEIASCELEIPREYKYRKYARCRPEVKESVPSLRLTRIVAASSGEPLCVPVKYGKKLVCGEKGTRCVCDTGEFEGNHKLNMPDPEDNHRCRCQWFMDYCAISGICSTPTKSCKTSVVSGLQCVDGSINQCLANPNLCHDQEGYCVELDDESKTWKAGTESIGDGFSCIKKSTFHEIAENAPFCNFDKTDHVVSVGPGFKKPGSNLDYCCYMHLVCILLGDEVGGYLFKKRPCYCNTEFRKCLLRLESDFSLWPHARALLSIVDHIEICTMDDTGKCNPLIPASCNKGDLIDLSIAHCQVNCRTGPLLPIEIRACRIRKCVPPNNLKDIRVIDVPYYTESSRCDAKQGLVVDCGMKETRCVCDGVPNTSYFTDGCRCQYWPE